MQHFTATYSPDDNKLRLYSVSRVDKELYERLKDAGFNFAPKQDLFVAPMWTPEREDLLVELAGEIEDDNKTLADRAEDRAERFGTYSENKAKESEQVRNATKALSDNIPFGQPILVGHHSEHRARKTAKRIDEGFRKSVVLWNQANYWTSRAKAAVRLAAYKERPDVRARRIKSIESDLRKRQRQIEEHKKAITLWSVEEGSDKYYRTLAGRDDACIKREGHVFPVPLWIAMDREGMSAEQARQAALKFHGDNLLRLERWINHYQLRLSYENAMLKEAGIDTERATQYDIMPGGKVLIGEDWLIVLKVNKRSGMVSSLKVAHARCPKRNISEVKAYEAPTDEVAAQVKAALKKPPLVNYPSEGFKEMTKSEYRAIHRDYKGTHTQKASGEYGAYRYRSCIAQGTLTAVYLTDDKRVERPAIAPA
jgi:hypothetical protein